MNNVHMTPTALAEEFDRIKDATRVQSEDGGTYHVYAMLHVRQGVPTITGFAVNEWMDGATLASFSNGREL